MSSFTGTIVEPIHPGVTADSTAVTADSTLWTADGGPLVGATETADAIREIAAIAIAAADAADIADAVSIVSANALEAADALDDADATGIFSTDAIEVAAALDDLDALVLVVGAAVMAEPAVAADVLDAEVVAAEVPVFGGYYPTPRRRPFPVVGVGYGVLPKLWGEAFGTVGVAGAGRGEIDEDEIVEMILILLAA